MTTQPTLEQALTDFLTALTGKNRSDATIRAYQTDVQQFISWLHENNIVALTPSHVAHIDITEYLGHLAKQQLAGVSCARKVAALRGYFRYLVDHGILTVSPLQNIETPKREKNGRTNLTREEYTAILSLAGGNARDYAVLQVFLQTGLRVSELVALHIDDIDLINRVLHVRAGKGQTYRSIELERKVTQAVKNYLASKPPSVHEHLFLNCDAEPTSERGVRKMVTNSPYAVKRTG